MCTDRTELFRQMQEQGTLGYSESVLVCLNPYIKRRALHLPPPTIAGLTKILSIRYELTYFDIAVLLCKFKCCIFLCRVDYIFTVFLRASHFPVLTGTALA